MTSASPSSSGRKTAAASAVRRSRADFTAVRSRCPRSSDADISLFASCNRRKRARLAIGVEGGTRYANLPLGERATGQRGRTTSTTSPPTSRATASASSREGLVRARSEEHTSELQSRQYLVCRLLLEKKNK